MPKRCNKKQVEKLRYLRMINDDMYELLEKILRRVKFDAEFGIWDDVDYNDNANEG